MNDCSQASFGLFKEQWYSVISPNTHYICTLSHALTPRQPRWGAAPQPCMAYVLYLNNLLSLYKIPGMESCKVSTCFGPKKNDTVWESIQLYLIHICFAECGNKNVCSHPDYFILHLALLTANGIRLHTGIFVHHGAFNLRQRKHVSGLAVCSEAAILRMGELYVDHLMLGFRLSF